MRDFIPILGVAVCPRAIEVAEGFDLHGVNLDLQTAVLGQAGQLFFSGIAFAQGHGNKLTHLLLTNDKAIMEAVSPGDEVILALRAQFVLPGLARDGVDLACPDLDSEGIVTGEGERQGFGLIQRQEDPATAAPVLGQTLHIVVDPIRGDGRQAGWHQIMALVIGHSQGATELDAAPGLFVDLGEGEVEGVAVEGQHAVSRASPVAITDFADQVLNGVVREVLDLA